ncbi:magnesium transporter [Scheffersomyces xylosifermentans]|uniref:magnesium transporter n=1 Tax=Scheffersomyces xylosifermentans TaxID=1304137 RepID=UPI00315DF639
MATNSSTAAFYVVGLLLLIHSGYSSFEFHKLSIVSHYHGSLPIDIVLETVIAIIIIVIGAITSVSNTPVLSLKGEQINSRSKFLKFIEMKDAVTVIESIGLSDYEELNTRVGFINIIKKRREYSEWLGQST